MTKQKKISEFKNEKKNKVVKHTILYRQNMYACCYLEVKFKGKYSKDALENGSESDIL